MCVYVYVCEIEKESLMTKSTVCSRGLRCAMKAKQRDARGEMNKIPNIHADNNVTKLKFSISDWKQLTTRSPQHGPINVRYPFINTPTYLPYVQI